MSHGGSSAERDGVRPGEPWRAAVGLSAWVMVRSLPFAVPSAMSAEWELRGQRVTVPSVKASLSAIACPQEGSFVSFTENDYNPARCALEHSGRFDRGCGVLNLKVDEQPA